MRTATATRNLRARAYRESLLANNSVSRGRAGAAVDRVDIGMVAYLKRILEGAFERCKEGEGVVTGAAIALRCSVCHHYNAQLT